MSQVTSSPTNSPGGASRPSGRRRWPGAVVVVVVLVAILVVIADHVTLGYYAIQPGEAQAVGPLVHVPPSKAHKLDGSVLLTDVFLSPVTLLGYVPDLLSSNTDLVPSSEVLGPDTSPAELTDQGYLQMAQSQDSAKTLALRSLGYHVGQREAGALVFSVAPGSPASSTLQVAQIITAVDGKATPNSCAFISAVHSIPAGTVAHLSVEESTVTPQAVVKPGPVVQRDITLGKPRPVPVSGCPGVSGPAQGYVGISVGSQIDYRYPFPIKVDVNQIGGPSAGLAMTLGIMDKLSNGDLTGHRKVAATGTIDPTGAVGDVSGVPQKTIAVEQAGATAFLVPPQELSAARSKATPSLHVYAVSSLGQALSVLRQLGGDVPNPNAATRPS